MKIEYDPKKSERNSAERDLPFSRLRDFDWAGALYFEDVRKPYPEPRYVGLGLIGMRVHSVCFTHIDGGVRIINFRKANPREVRRYDHRTLDR